MEPSKNIMVAVIGSGFAGIGMGIRLKDKGIEDFLIFERAADVGGVWRDNTYPGCGCDVESSLYSFSFFQNPKWSRLFSRQPEILKYLKHGVDHFGLHPHLLFNHEFQTAHWEPGSQRWRVQTSQGIYHARILVSAMGAFSEPFTPQIKGLETFKGEIFHSARWNHGYDLKSRKVAVVGTGASAIQFVPEIQPLVKKLILFQRTPAWIMKRPDRILPKAELERLTRFPFLQKLRRLKFYLIRELIGMTFRHPRMMGFGTGMALHQLKKVVKDPGLRDKLIPKYIIGCKRILLSNEFYPALIRENIELVTEGLVEVRANSIVTSDGREREIDAIIFGTGFHVTDFHLSEKIFDGSGRNLDQVWQGSPRAYLGITVPSFPNFFFLLGPNTGLGHSSVVLMIEAQIEYTLKAILFLQKNPNIAIEPFQEKEAEFIAKVDQGSQKTVWLSGCKSWYLDIKGRNSSLWPRGIGAFGRRVKRFRKWDYNEISL